MPADPMDPRAIAALKRAITIQDGKMVYTASDGRQLSKPECLGVAWEAVGEPYAVTDRDPETGFPCRTCGFRGVCLDKFRPQVIAKHKAGATLDELATKLEVNTEALVYVGVKPPDKEQPQTQEKTVPKKKKKKAAKKKVAKKTTKKVAKKVPKKVAKKAVKKVTKKVAKKKKKVAKPRPSKAASVKSAKASASKKKAKTTARRASAQDAPLVWGTDTFKERWIRERAKSPLISRLTPGMTVRADRNGIRYELKVKDGYYLVSAKGEGAPNLPQGERYPTLFKTSQAASGSKSTWSGAKFWKLAMYVKKLDAQ